MENSDAHPPVRTLDWNAPSPYTRVNAATATGVGAQALVEEYTIDTPENVAFRYEIAGIGSRSIGGIVDTLLIAALLFALLLALFFAAEYLPSSMNLPDAEWVTNLLIALYVLADFAIFWGYYLLFELFWNGQTPGKRLARTRVVQVDGMPAGFTEVAVRNLVRIVDLLPTAYAVGLITMFSNASARRLGDFAAGTLVIHDQGEVTLDSLLDANRHTATGRRRGRQTTPISSAPAHVVTIGQPVPTPATSPATAGKPAIAPALAEGPFGANLAALTPEDIELIRDALTREWRGQLDLATLHRLARAIAAKTGTRIPAVERSSVRLFLTKIADAYTLAQD